MCFCNPIFAKESNNISFDVYRKGNKIGYHNLVITHQGNKTIVEVNINFEVNFLGFLIYEYKHKNKEIWDKKFLQTLNAETIKNNGEKLVCNIKSNNSELEINGTNGKFQKSNILMPSSYWNYELVKGESKKTMINTQDCSLIDIEILNLGSEKIYNSSLNSKRYKITGKEISGENIDIDIWYDEDNNWVKMIFKKDGNLIEYYLRKYNEFNE